MGEDQPKAFVISRSAVRVRVGAPSSSGFPFISSIMRALSTLDDTREDTNMALSTKIKHVDKRPNKVLRFGRRFPNDVA